MQKFFYIILSISKNSGFTLIEIIAVLAILGILASLSIPRFIDLGSNATKQALICSVTELNGRESLTWSKVKLSNTGWVEDEGVFAKMDTGLGPDYKWSPNAKLDGGKVHYKDLMVKLDRKPSTANSPAKWEITKMSSD
ncbi:MAG: type II secretion system protein [Deltaproteobacteria bacterium]|nr:type II secretion system protein [Deltaproteobacteria bacterium]